MLNNKMCVPYFYESRFFNYIGFGLNKLFEIKVGRNCFVLAICHFNSIQKKFELTVEFNPFVVMTKKY